MNNVYLRPLIFLVPTLLVLSFGINYFFSSSEVGDNSIGSKFDVSLLNFDSLEDINGVKKSILPSHKVIIVHFWASWCGPCVEEFPQLIDMVSSMKGEVVVYAISGDSVRSEIDVFLKSFPGAIRSQQMHIVWDAEKKNIQNWQVNKLPESYIYDSNKKLVKRISGAVDWSSADAKDFIKSIAGK